MFNVLNNPHRLKTQIWDANGNEVWHKDGEAHSFVRNIHNMVATQILDIAGDNDTADEYGIGSLTVVRTDGTSLPNETTPYDIGNGAASGTGYQAAVGDSTHGVVVGTGTSGFTFEDFQLGTPILSGSCDAELAHSSSEPVAVTFDTNSSRFSVDYARSFNNNSTASITVSEIGMVAIPLVPTGNQSIMVCRDALSPTLPIAVGGQLKVTYTFTSQQFTS